MNTYSYCSRITFNSYFNRLLTTLLDGLDFPADECCVYSKVNVITKIIITVWFYLLLMFLATRALLSMCLLILRVNRCFSLISKSNFNHFFRVV